MPSQPITDSKNIDSGSTTELWERCSNTNTKRGRNKRANDELQSGYPEPYFAQANVQVSNWLRGSGALPAMMTHAVVRHAMVYTPLPTLLSERHFKSAESGPAAPAPATGSVAAQSVAQPAGQHDAPPPAAAEVTEMNTKAAFGDHDPSHIDRRPAEKRSLSEDMGASPKSQALGQGTVPQLNRDATMAKTAKAAEKSSPTLNSQKSSAARGAAAPQQGSQLTYTLKVPGPADTNKVNIHLTPEARVLTPSNAITRENLAAHLSSNAQYQLFDQSGQGHRQHQQQDDPDQIETVQLNKREKSR